ncbi:serine-rich adhesin for platelets isoform X1 [Colletes gigas]|uniref:serine-rich adhesin for platelets isoform X1 n=1 Tax=Colletes gigas TaxID=935657 RepID=UPI001C9AF0A5|nr:serine-rich adhesin for platelets isoform X1 [Colletes gigas]XP_043264359.1 serine-rich adhesin for platelets isoform X1 [Colletes gigas]XP_043264360.1 serine-rich adhesin for platelets isoform X1 [Colletes gigas]XP_043264361.1 serine-rich adhesin for platelets isoform X1 [Colletes gigas]XP_043264363.1 serine-rich adhesin for platelets isoform X1 [Colletes gigas]XP_043264364.1 serine-rich adhesin for platelets isoform X1 [Colletes gigas]
MEQFEQLLTCAICLDRYRNPKLLPCQHSFCMEPCMDGLIDYVRRQLKCPECRAEHRVPYQGVQAFPTNVTLQRFLELHIEITGELPDPTSGQTMERCGVCSEKSYCSLCVHCEKKCCSECKDAHMDILRREITRINSQIRRGLHRLQDALALVEKNTLGLQTNCASVAEEVDEIYRRLSKALKDRTEHLRNEVDRYLSTELRGMIQLKENLELEIANIQSNCDLAEAHINENVPWDDSELLDTKELFLRTVEFIRNFEYEAGDYSRRVRFVMAHDPNQLVLHVAGYGELNIKPETGSGGLLGSSSSLAPPGGSPGLMRSKSDHRLASQYRQQEEERLARNRYLPEYDHRSHRYEAPEYEVSRNKSRYRSRFMRHRDGDDSDGDTRSTVRFTSTPQESSGLRERVLDTEDAARGPLSGIFRLTDSPRVMKKLQEYERAGKRKKEEPAPHPVQQTPPPKPQVQIRKVPTAMARQTSEDDEISRIKKQNKTVATPPATETVEERPTPRETPPEREPEEPVRRPIPTRRTSTDTHAPATRGASSDSSTGSESSGGSGIRSTGAPFTAEEMKQKYLARAPTSNSASTVSTPTTGTTTPAKDSTNATTPATRTFQSRFLGTGNRAAPAPPTQAPAAREETKEQVEQEDDEDEETSSSNSESESETEESDVETTRPANAPYLVLDIEELTRKANQIAKTRRGSEDSPSTRYSTPRGSPALTTSSTTTTSPTTTATGAVTSTATGAVTSTTTPAGYTSRTFSDEHDEPSTDRREDYDIAAKNADYDIDGADGSMVKPQSNKRTHTDDSTDTDETITSSSSSYATRSKCLEGSGYDSRLENRNEARKVHALVEGRSVNDASSSLSALNDRRISVNGVSLENSREKSTVDKGDSVSGESDSETESETDSETDEEEERSRDENSNLRNKKTENAEDNDRTSKTENGSADSKTDDGSTESDTDDEITVLSAPRSEDRYGNSEQHDETAKRRSSSIIGEKSIEELFDDNGWVVTDQDLQPEGSRKISKSDENSEQKQNNREGNNTLSQSGSSESLPRNRVYRQSSIGKNGWLVSDESDSETDRAASSPDGPGVVDASKNQNGEQTARNKDDKGPMATDSAWNIDENGWVILNKVDDTPVAKDVEGQSTDETSTIRSQTTDLVTRTNIENGALVANATQSKETDSSNEHEDTPGVNITIPMQMVSQQEQKPGSDDSKQGTRKGTRTRTRKGTRKGTGEGTGAGTGTGTRTGTGTGTGTRTRKRTRTRTRTRRGYRGRVATVGEVAVRNVEGQKTAAGAVQKLPQLRR